MYQDNIIRPGNIEASPANARFTDVSIRGCADERALALAQGPLGQLAGVRQRPEVRLGTRHLILGFKPRLPKVPSLALETTGLARNLQG
jgi:hypothetical protein